jgi:hypothetical protein
LAADLQGKRAGAESHSDEMKAKIDAEYGRRMITRRFATVEPGDQLSLPPFD